RVHIEKRNLVQCRRVQKFGLDRWYTVSARSIFATSGTSCQHAEKQNGSKCFRFRATGTCIHDASLATVLRTLEVLQSPQVFYREQPTVGKFWRAEPHGALFLVVIP